MTTVKYGHVIFLGHSVNRLENHDGTNHYLYRVFKDTVSPEQIERLQEKIYFGKATRADITKVTKRLGDEIAAVYGFHIPKQKTAKEQAR